MKRLSAILAAALCLAVTGTAALAQDKYPSKPVRILVPYSPGGATDIVARIFAEQLRGILGQTVVVENKPGAFGIIAIEEMAHSKPDGYTLMVGNVSTNAITSILYKKKFSINYEKDVIPVARLVDVPAFVTVATKNFEPKTLKELIDYAKKNPGKLRYGTVGAGSYPQYDAEVFAKRAGFEAVSIPNTSGASGIIKDMATGDVQMAFLNVASAGPMIKAGQIRAIAQVNDTRLADYPDIPTMAELGYPNVGTKAWQALFAPAGTPPAVLDTLNKAILKAAEAPQLKEAFEKQYFNIVPSKDAAEAKVWLAKEIADWKKITDEVKIELGN